MRLSASQFADYDRCGLLYAYKRTPGLTRLAFSAPIFGTVVHHCLRVMERNWTAPLGEIDRDALDQALLNFQHYWHPERIAEIAEPIVEWMRGHSWSTLAEKGTVMLSDYAANRARDDSIVLALEYEFDVPLVGTEHRVSGYIDKLVVRRYNRKPYLSADDYKTGRTKTFLRHDVQGHIYCYASTQPEFWTPFGERAEELWQAYKDLPRRFRWVSLKDGKHHDTWRSEPDWDRLRMMANAVAGAVEHKVFIPTLNGSACEYCDFGPICGGAPLPAEDDGRPTSLPLTAA